MKRKWKLFKRKKENNRGVTLIEALVATVILALAVVPLMNSLVVTARINGKARKQQETTTLCQTIMEQVKAQTPRELFLETFSVWTDSTVPNMDIANNTVPPGHVMIIAGTNSRLADVWYGVKDPDASGVLEYRKVLREYALYYDDIDGYDVRVDVLLDESSSNKDGTVSIGYKSYTDHGLAQYLQYNVTISLYKNETDRNNGTNAVATFSGSARDFVFVKYEDPN